MFDGSRIRNLVDYANNEFRALARDAGVSVCLIPVRTLDDVRGVPRIVEREHPQAVMIWGSAFVYQHREALVGSTAHRLPIISDVNQLAELGAILTYSVDWMDQFRRSAAYVDKILGAPSRVTCRSSSQPSLSLR